MQQIALLILGNIGVHVQYTHHLYQVVCDILQDYWVCSFGEEGEEFAEDVEEIRVDHPIDEFLGSDCI